MKIKNSSERRQNQDEEVKVFRHPRTIGWFGTASLAMGGSNQSLFLIAALFAGQGDIPGQGSAAVPLLIVGLLLSWAAAPGWTELILMWPNRIGVQGSHFVLNGLGQGFLPLGHIFLHLSQLIIGQFFPELMGCGDFFPPRSQGDEAFPDIPALNPATDTVGQE